MRGSHDRSVERGLSAKQKGAFLMFIKKDLSATQFIRLLQFLEDPRENEVRASELIYEGSITGFGPDLPSEDRSGPIATLRKGGLKEKQEDSAMIFTVDIEVKDTIVCHTRDKKHQMSHANQVFALPMVFLDRLMLTML